MSYFSYILLYGACFLALSCAAWHVYQLRHKLDEMHGMMVAMTFGMLAGLLTATLFVIPTGNFLWGVILGSLVGLAFGIPFGKTGGHLGIMEGVMAGPMGGMMGAMLGQMIRPFSLAIFMPFFVFILLLSLIGISYAAQCGSCQCDSADKRNNKRNKQDETKREKNATNSLQRPNPSTEFIAMWVIASVFLGILSIFLTFDLDTSSTTDRSGKTAASSSQDSSANSLLPPALQALTKENVGETVVNGNVQEIDLVVAASSYVPNVIKAKKGIPLIIHATAEENAGCGREIVFKDFDVRAIVPESGSQDISLLPEKEGTFGFSCSMNMVKGKLIVS